MANLNLLNWFYGEMSAKLLQEDKKGDEDNEKIFKSKVKIVSKKLANNVR